MATSNEIASKLGLDKIESTAEMLRTSRTNVEGSSLPGEEKRKLLTSLTESIEALTLGSVVERLQAANAVHTGQDPAYQKFQLLMTDRLMTGLTGENPNPGNALMARLLERVVDQLPLAGPRDERVDVVRQASDEVMAQVMKQFLGGALNPNQGDPVSSVIRSQMETMLANAVERMNAPAPGFAAELTGALGTIAGAKEALAPLFPQAVAPAAPSAEMMQMENRVMMERLNIEERVAMHRLDLEHATELQKAESLGKIADMLGNGIEAIGQALGKAIVSGEVAEPEQPAAAPARQRKPAAHVLECPSCEQQAIHLTPEMYANVQSGGGPYDVKCESCGADHTIGGKGASPPAADADADAEPGDDPDNELGAVPEHVTVATA